MNFTFLMDISTKGWFNDLIRGFFGYVDYAIYSLVRIILKSVFAISQLQTSSELLDSFYQRLYAFLTIFMVFKLTFSLLKYVVNPDAMSDKQQGAGKLIARVITSVCMLIALPIVWGYLPKIQGELIEIVPKIILGSTDAGNKISENADTYGEAIAVTTLRAFYQPNESMGKIPINTMYDFLNTINEPSSGKKGTEYDYNYQFGLSTACGVLLIVTLIGIVIDIGGRVFKLIILQMLAPVPVISYIDPNSSKDGAFSSWLKTFVSTFVDLFVNLAIVYLVIFFLTKIVNSGLFENYSEAAYDNSTKAFVTVFLILGLLLFAKDAPKFIKDAIGIKSSSNGSVFGKALSAMGGAAAAGAGALAGGAGLMGALSAAGGGLISGAKNAGSGNPLGAYSKTRDEIAKTLGKTPGGILGRLNKWNTERKFENMGASVSDLEEAEKLANNAKEEMMRAERDYGKNSDEHIAATMDYMDKQSKYESIKSARSSAGLKPGLYEKHRAKRKEKTSGASSISNVSQPTSPASPGLQSASPASPGLQSASPAQRPNTYSDGTLMPDSSVEDYGRNTTFRENRKEETGMQQRINDAAHVHDAPTEQEHDRNIRESAFVNMSDEEFERHQRRVDTKMNDNKES